MSSNETQFRAQAASPASEPDYAAPFAVLLPVKIASARLLWNQTEAGTPPLPEEGHEKTRKSSEISPARQNITNALARYFIVVERI